MSGAAIGWAKAQRAPSVTAKAVLICLADYADENGVAWPSIPTLAAEVQASERTIQRCIRSLEEAGLLTRSERHRKDGGDTSNAYNLAMTPGDIVTPPRCHPVTPPVSLVSPANGTPIDPITPDGDKARGRQAGFDQFWSAYPSKVGKKAALAAWLRAKDRPPLPDVLAALDRYKRTKPADREWCNPATWLNQGRWDDGEPTAQAMPVQTFTGPAALRASVVAAKDEAFALAWIDPCGWDDENRTLLARNTFALKKLRAELGEWMVRHKVRAEITTPAQAQAA